MPPRYVALAAASAPASALADELAIIVGLVLRLQPSWQQPDRFHEAKSEVVSRLRALARRSW